MDYTQKSYKIQCEFAFIDGKGAVLEQVEIHGDTHKCTLEFSWSWAASDALRTDFVEFLTALMGRCFPVHRSGGIKVETANFLAQLPGLRFENLAAERGPDNSGTLCLRMTRGNLADLLTAAEDKKSHAPVDDVFLPLRNLSSYLQAMKDQTGDQSCSRAVAMTADRIDEFLLIYGGRLHDSLVSSERSNLQ